MLKGPGSSILGFMFGMNGSCDVKPVLPGLMVDGVAHTSVLVLLEILDGLLGCWFIASCGSM